MDCSCEMLWYRAWLQETESHYPGPRCRDGSMLRESRLSRSECISDGRNNRLPLTNEHGDVFNRKNDYDECELENIETYSNNNNNNKLPPSPEESDYFYDQYVDYPNNDINETFLATSNHSAPVNAIPNDANRNKIKDEIVDFNKNKFNNFGQKPPPPPPPQNNSPFTFFGVPIPSIGNVFGNNHGRNGKHVNINALNGGSRGTGRVQTYRPNESVDHKRGTSERPVESSESDSNENRKPAKPENNLFSRPEFQTPFHEPKPEKGGFSPIVPGTQGGFTPVNGPQKESDSASTESKAKNVTSNEWPDYFEEVPIITESSKEGKLTTKRPPNLGTVNRIERRPDSSSAQEENDEESQEQSKEKVTESSRSFKRPPPPPTTIQPNKNWKQEKPAPSFQPIPDDRENEEISDKYEESELNVSLPKVSTSRPHSSESIEQTPLETFKTSKEVFDGVSKGPSALSALVAPGAQQGIYRKSTITKVNKDNRLSTPEEPLYHSSSTTQQPTSRDDNEFSSTHERIVTNPPLELTEEPVRKPGMDWYFKNYNNTDAFDDYPSPGMNSMQNINSSGNYSKRLSVLLFVLVSVRFLF